LDVNGNAYGNFGAPWQDSNVNVDALLWLGGSTYPAQSIYTTLAPQTGPRIYAAVYNGTSSQLYRNGSLQATAGSGFAGPANGTTITIGSAWQGIAADAFLGSIAEFILFNGILTTTQRQQIEGYLAWKWGLQGNLTTGAVAHPYKSFRP
jgi:hypothetical protein